MLVINGKTYKYKRNLSIDFKNKILKKEELEFGCDKIYDWYKVPKDYSLDFMLEIVNIIFSGIPEIQIVQYIKKTGEKMFNRERFFEYVEYRRTNKSDVQSFRYFELIYGDLASFYMKEKFKNRNSIYDVDYISRKHNISIEESIIKIEEFKKNKKTNLEGFIKRHGEVLGKEKFEKFQNTSKHTLDKFIDKFGDDGVNKWNEYLKKKDSTSYEWALKKSNDDHELANKLHTDRINKLSSIKFNFDYFINKYGDESTALIELDKFKKRRDTVSYEWALRKSNGDPVEADRIYLERSDKKTVRIGKSSMESLYLFNPLIEWLLENGIKWDDVMLGVKGSKEFFLYDKENKLKYFYDFYIDSLKLIIEYNGERFHPNYEKYSNEYLVENWKSFISIGALEKINKDKAKIEYAKSKGYDIIVIWSSDDNKLDKCKNLIKEKIKEKYENKIN